MTENVIEIEEGAVFGRFPAGTLVRIVGRPAAPGRACRSQRCQEFVLPDAASYGITVESNGEYQVVRADPPFGVSTIGEAAEFNRHSLHGAAVDQTLDPPVRADLAARALDEACDLMGWPRSRKGALFFPENSGTRRHIRRVADVLVKWYRAGSSGELVPK